MRSRIWLFHRADREVLAEEARPPASCDDEGDDDSDAEDPDVVRGDGCGTEIGELWGEGTNLFLGETSICCCCCCCSCCTVTLEEAL